MPKRWIAGMCIWCGEWVSSQREEAGAPAETEETDPCWATDDGDFGCDKAPDTTWEEGGGDHATMQQATEWYLALRKQKEEDRERG